ncbi:hypothetical protein U1554_21770, partial [Aeromonas caviae]
QQGDGGGVFGDSQFTSTLSVNFHFPKIPRRTENKPSRTACAQMAIDRLVAQYGSLHQLDRLNCKPVINETADCAR